jgi:hypothetical protein
MPDISVTICTNKDLGIHELLAQTLEQSKLYDLIELKRKNKYLKSRF